MAADIRLFTFWLHYSNPVGPAQVIPPPAGIIIFTAEDHDQAWREFHSRDWSDNAAMLSAERGARLECSQFFNAEYSGSTWQTVNN